MPQHGVTDELPKSVTDTTLWSRVSGREEYVDTIRNIRRIAIPLSQRVSVALPEYTDHSVAHMDSLWRIADQVLTSAEIARFTASEALLLGSSFYVHDLGMSLPATRAGAEEIRSTEAYRVARARFAKLSADSGEKVDELALREATRELHAKKALDLATKPVPSLGTFLIENTDFRARWGDAIGTVSESHHWGLSEVERLLGVRGVTPGPDGEAIDFAYIACMLRIVDFAHINRDRAPGPERQLRSDLPEKSRLHWDAQGRITGPLRDGDALVFGCTQPLVDIEAWWFFHDLAVNLDAEIKGVYEYLRNRTVSLGRFSLQCVRGVEDPSAFNRYVRLPEEVVPIDIRVQPDSMERVVELLGGRHIYGDDQLAPIRELIQNARDAIELRCAVDRMERRPTAPGQIVITLERAADQSILKIADNGVGMTRTVVRRHLVAVGSDFWNSVEFYRKFSNAVDAGFRPIGRFGIGFLSVFMLGNHVEVETESAGGSRICLTLEGLGRRGELIESHAVGQVGTEIRVRLTAATDELPANLPAIVRARAPMLTVPITVVVKDGDSSLKDVIEPGWWRQLSEKDFFSFVATWPQLAKHGGQEEVPRRRHRYVSDSEYFYHRDVYFGGKWSVKGWPGDKPTYLTEKERLISSGGELSLGVIRCSQGIAVDLIHVGDLSGVADMGPVELSVSRETLASSDPESLRAVRGRDTRGEKFLSDIRSSVIDRVNGLQTYGMLPGRLDFLRGLTLLYGNELLDRTALRWIPVTQPPGDLIHRSKAELLESLKDHQRLLIATGLTPAQAYSVASPLIPSAELSKYL